MNKDLLRELVEVLEQEKWGGGDPQYIPTKDADQSSAGIEAKRKGLHHIGWGRYADKSGMVTHKSVGGKLVPVKRPRRATRGTPTVPSTSPATSPIDRERQATQQMGWKNTPQGALSVPATTARQADIAAREALKAMSDDPKDHPNVPYFRDTPAEERGVNQLMVAGGDPVTKLKAVYRIYQTARQGNDMGTADKARTLIKKYHSHVKTHPVGGKQNPSQQATAQKTTSSKDSVSPPSEWWKSDPEQLLAHIYWLRDQIPPHDKSSAYRQIVQQLQKKFPTDPEIFQRHMDAFEKKKSESIKEYTPSTRSGESQAGEEAKRKGLHHIGYGKYADKKGVVTHRSEKGKLVPVQGEKPAASQSAPEQPEAPQPAAAIGQPEKSPTTPADTEILRAGPIEIDTAGMQVTVNGKPVHLSKLEYKLLIGLAANKGRVQSRAQLLQTVWQANPDILTRTVDMHLKRLRAKLGPEAAPWIETVRGFGYRLKPGDQTATPFKEKTSSIVVPASKMTEKVMRKISDLVKQGHSISIQPTEGGFEIVYKKA